MDEQKRIQEEPVEDLDLAESESEQVKGGSINFSKIEFKYDQPKNPSVVESVGVKY